MIKYNHIVDKILTFVWIVVLVYVGYEVAVNADAVWARITHIDIPYLTAGLLLGLTASFPSVWILKDYFNNIGSSITFSLSFLLTFLPAMGKYIPGKIWAVGTFILHAKTAADIHTGEAAVYQIYFLIVGLIATLILLIAGYLTGYQTLFQIEILYSVGILLLCFPAGCYLLRQKVEKYEISIRINRMLIHVLAMIGQKLLRGLCLLLFLTAFINIQGIAIDFLFAFVIAIQIGLLAFFAPAGLGVTEAVYVYLLAPLAGMETAILIALLSRIWHMGMDAILAGAALVLKKTEQATVLRE